MYSVLSAYIYIMMILQIYIDTAMGFMGPQMFALLSTNIQYVLLLCPEHKKTLLYAPAGARAIIKVSGHQHQWLAGGYEKHQWLAGGWK